MMWMHAMALRGSEDNSVELCLDTPFVWTRHMEIRVQSLHCKHLYHPSHVTVLKL